MEDESNSVGYFFLGLGLGVLAGVLFAPKSGEETRDLIRSKAGEGSDYVRRRSLELRDAATDALDRGKEGMRRQKDNLSAAMEAGKQAYRDAVNKPVTE